MEWIDLILGTLALSLTLQFLGGYFGIWIGTVLSLLVLVVALFMVLFV